MALEAHRDVRARWLSDLSRDTRFALRTLRHNPALTVAAIMTLAVGIGANTAIFSTLHAVVLRPLPFRDSDRLVMLYETNPERGWTQAEVARQITSTGGTGRRLRGHRVHILRPTTVLIMRAKPKGPL
jgi:hypothetical protein